MRESISAIIPFWTTSEVGTTNRNDHFALYGVPVAQRYLRLLSERKWWKRKVKIQLLEIGSGCGYKWVTGYFERLDKIRECWEYIPGR